MECIEAGSACLEGLSSSTIFNIGQNTSGKQFCPDSSPLTTKPCLQSNQTKSSYPEPWCHDALSSSHSHTSLRSRSAKCPSYPHNTTEPIFICTCRNKGNMTMRYKVASPACRSNMERSIAKSSRICDLLVWGWKCSSLTAYITDRVLAIFFTSTTHPREK
jgi:hypothetical protein